MLKILSLRFLKAVAQDIAISLVLVTVYQLIIYKGFCLFSGMSECSRIEFLKQSVPLGTFYISLFMILFYEVPQIIIYSIRIKKGLVAKK